MILSIIKYTFIYICIFLFFKNLLNLEKRNNLLILAISTLFSVISVPFRYVSNILNLIIIIILSFTGLKKLYDKPIILTLNTCIISIGLSFFTDTLSMLITAPLTYILGTIMHFNFVFNLFSYIVLGLVQITFIVLLFSSKRLKKGLKFLYKIQNSTILTFLCCGIITFYYLFRLMPESTIFYITIVLFITIIGIIIYFNSHKQLMEDYLHKNYSRAIESLENELNLTKSEKVYWYNYSQQLGSIIHKDNKLIPAMITTVEQLANNYNAQNANDILAELHKLGCERTGLIQEHIHNTMFLSQTNSIRIDAIINYMFQKASVLDINLSFQCNSDIYNIIPEYIPDVDLSTLIADLLENAIIATKTEQNRNILLCINSLQLPYSINVYDSGSFFAKEVLNHFGRSRYTTHKKDGGSGIGLMTIFELTNKYKASFIIDETVKNDIYTKCVSIVFDNKNTHIYNGKIIY